jgi:hypothetical protein
MMLMNQLKSATLAVAANFGNSCVIVAANISH